MKPRLFLVSPIQSGKTTLTESVVALAQERGITVTPISQNTHTI